MMVDALHPPIVITGRTRVVGVMAWPVAHSLSPPMHNAAYAAAGMDMVYVPFPVHPDHVADAIRGARALGMVGVNVTLPHKPAVAALMDALSPEAAACKSVNTVQILDDGTLMGHSTDAFGFLKSLEVDGGYTVAGRQVVLVGTGGAGQAMAVGLTLAGAGSITLLNRTAARREALAALLERLRGDGDKPLIAHGAPDSDLARAAVREADLIVNASSLGMKADDPTPVDTDLLGPEQFVYDAIYTPRETRLLAEGRRRGCRTLGGLGMLVYQGARAVEIWTGRWPDAGRMQAVLEGLL